VLAAPLAVPLWAQVPGGQPPSGQDPAAPQQPPTRVDAPGLDGSDVIVDDAVRRMQGRTVRAIKVERRASDGSQLPVDAASAESFVRSLLTRVGQPFEQRNVSTDCANLWNERRLVVSAYAQEIDQEVVVTFLIEREVEVYEGVEFVGLRNLARGDVDSLLGLSADRQVTRTEAEAMRKVLLTRYRRDGYAFCSVELKERPVEDREAGPDSTVPGQRATRPRNTARFVIDEGSRVTVRKVQFVGNTSFAADPNFGLFGSADYLLRDSHLQSDPRRGLVNGGSYSREILEEDLDRLRLFYRSRGFLDATVDIGDVLFTEDRTEVDVTFLGVEGPRYRIKSVRVEHIDERGKELTTPALYSPEEVLAECKVKPGEYYDHQRLERDWQAIKDFYGRRGHPPLGFPGMQNVQQACMVSRGSEIYGLEPEVEIVFQVREGVPKTLRDVVIRGNRFTRDEVIRRRVRVLPGERINMEEVDRALRSIEQTRFFTDRLTLQGPRVQIEPVPASPDQVDLAIDVEDGATGELRWGVSIGTGQGAAAYINYNKRNFDLWNPPSSWDPVTAIDEMLSNRAFHGGGQTLGLLLQPGSKQSQFQLTYIEPDVFRQYFETYELRTAAYRRIRRLPDGYTSDVLGGEVGLSRNFTEEFNAGLFYRLESVDIKDLAPDASSLAFDSEGTTRLTGPRLAFRYRDVDDIVRPTSGFELALSGEMLGGIFGGEVDLWKVVHRGEVYVPLYENEMSQRTVLHLQHLFGLAQAFGDNENVFLTERFYMGGRDLRGFDYRQAGPSQFGRPIGGEATYQATVEVYFPLVSTRLEGEVRDREVLRGVLFTDFGLLGLAIDDPSFGEVRASSGFGVRIDVPYLNVPIALDLGWPWLYEETDSRRRLYFFFGY
jgi:outer membrane protein insertion porin family